MPQTRSRSSHAAPTDAPTALSGSAAAPAPHLVPLGSGGWWMWRDVVLRGAGFPARLARELSDQALARAADARNSGELGPEQYRAEFDAAAERLRAVVRRTAADPRFREAVTWQNRALVSTCLDKAAAGEPRNVRGRNHELAIVGHLQRYALKNDTIGFFGPVGWATWTEGDTALTVAPGERFLARRTVSFEHWAIEAVAQTLSEDPALRPWLLPRREAAVAVHGRLLHRPEGLPRPLDEADAALLRACDGTRTVRELGGELVGPGRAFPDERALWEALARLRDERLVAVDLSVPITYRPEAVLRKKLAAIDDPAVRERATGLLDRLVAARDEVAAAAGDASALGAAMDRLNSTFTEITGREPVRRPGQVYAGRTLVYEDTVRDVRVELGRTLRDELSVPLGLVLDSARWLANRIATGYREVFTDLYRRWRKRSRTTAMPLARLLGLATPHLYIAARSDLVPVTRQAVQDLRNRWRQVVDGADRTVDEDGRQQYSAALLAERVAELFPAAPPAWSTAVHHSPDLLIAARSEEAVRRGEWQAVLGELHMAYNTLESSLFVEQHERPDALRAADAADHDGRRVVMLPPRDWPEVTSRTSPPSAMLAPNSTYWALRDPCVEPPGRVLPLADLFVHEEAGAPVVRDRTGTFEAPLLEVLSESLSNLSSNCFTPFPVHRHRPRITVDRLVVAREAWSFPVEELSWTAVRSEPERFRAARAWRAEHGVPEQVFYKSPTEEKPVFADFSSITLVNMFAKTVRQVTQRDPRATISLTEMLPGPEETWLTDHAGERYTAELRVVVCDSLR